MSATDQFLMSVSAHQEALRSVIAQGKEMRRLQKLYFQTRSKAVLIDSKAAEKKFDQLCDLADDRLGYAVDLKQGALL